MKDTMSTMLDCTECFAVRGVTMIDTIDSATGLTSIYGKTLAQVRAEGVKPWADYTQTERMSIVDYCASKAATQDTPITWSPITEEVYWDAMDALPPAAYRPDGFLLGEPYDHHALTGQPRYDAYKQAEGDYYHASRPLTVAEFKKGA